MSDKLKILAEERNSSLHGFSLAVSGYGLAAIRGALTLNGSAAVAVLTKQATITAEGKEIIWLCAIGAGLAVLCAGTSFLAQWCQKAVFSESSAHGIFTFQRTGLSQSLGPVPYIWRGGLAFWVSATLFSISVSCFFMAVYKLILVL